ncbi:unnamed protein product [Rhizoctonia solani]|uniref:Alginate lyase domain-containing protein n=1 Tax=Rhizoctonia solani TaxID=456999 RepID=A0A8H3GPQ1_9AGAM|nr:unnamed protein product [Rhizoctonia solani]
MKLARTLLVGFALGCSNVWGSKRIKGLSHNAQELFDIAMAYNNYRWDSIRGTTGAGSARATAWYAVGLLTHNDGSDVATARDIIQREIDAQYLVPGNPWYGTCKKTFEEPIPGTAQYPASIYTSQREFVGTAFILAIEEYSNLLGKSLVNNMLASLKHAVLGGLTRVGLDGDNLDLIYTNLALTRAFSTGWLGYVNQEEIQTSRKQLNMRPSYHKKSIKPQTTPLPNLMLQPITVLICGHSRCGLRVHYNANLKNFAGPYNRTYGNDITTYMAVIGLYQSCVTGKSKASLPPKLYASKHIDDWARGHSVALTCDIAVKYASLKAKSAMTKFTTSRYIERHIRSSETNDTRRPVTTWIENWAMLGGESISETVHVRGKQFVPGLIQWSPKKGWISWIRSRRLG